MAAAAVLALARAAVGGSETAVGIADNKSGETAVGIADNKLRICFRVQPIVQNETVGCPAAAKKTCARARFSDATS